MGADKIHKIEKHYDVPIMSFKGTSGGRRKVAELMELNVSINDAGTWEDIDDGRLLWRLRVDSYNAHFMSFKFSKFKLPPGAELYFVSVYRDFQIGPFTEKHNQPTGRFGSPVIAGDAAVIELYLPGELDEADLTLESVSYGFKNALGMGRFPYRKNVLKEEKELRQPLPDNLRAKSNFSCQRDINCPEGAPFQNEKRAVGQGYDGAYVCSGQLVNNVRQDNRYFYLTAAHCEWYLDPSTMSYYWNYENTGCGTNDYPAYTYSVGSINRFYNTSDDRDINLLELTGIDLENTYNFYYMGWNRNDAVPPTSCSMISHPDDKPKQIVIHYGPIVDCAIGSCPFGWGTYFWRVNGWDVGVDERGSSGGGLMDQNHLLIGTLTGGVGEDCYDFVWDEFAKISYEWAGLQPWLDPDNTGVMSLPGKDHTAEVCNTCGDLDSSGGDVDLNDFAIFANCWGENPLTNFHCTCANLIESGDHEINLLDLSVLAQLFLSSSADYAPNCSP